MQTKSTSFHEHVQRDKRCISSRPEISESTNFGVIIIKHNCCYNDDDDDDDDNNDNDNADNDNNKKA